MGNCCCCLKKSNNYCDLNDDNDENQRILDHAVGINDGDHRDTRYGSTLIRNSSQFGNQNQLNGNLNSNQSNNPNQQQQQNNLNNNNNSENQQNQLYQNVLDRLTSRVIDIAAIEKSCEQADLTDREQAYRDKLMSIRRSIQLPSNHLMPVPDAEYPQQNKEPMPIEDYKLITDLTIKLNSAIEEGFKIHCDEPFVVNFDA